MNTKRLILTGLIMLSFFNCFSQELTPKQLEKQENKVKAFTSEERDNMQMWFYERVNEMNLSEAKREEYYSIILYYSVKMKRLDDKDLGFTSKEIEEKFDSLLKKQEKEIKKILTQEAYEMHTKNYQELIRGVRNRMANTKS